MMLQSIGNKFEYKTLLVLLGLIACLALSGTAKTVYANTNTNTFQQNTNSPQSTQTPRQTTSSPVPEYREDGSGGFVPCGNTADNPCNLTHLFRAFVVIVNYMITMAGFVAVVAIAYAGFMMVVSQGEGRLVEAKGRFAGAIIGLILTAIAFVLVNTLFEGSLNVGVRNGGQILTSPLEYIRGP